MSVSIQQVLNDAKKLASRLKGYENTTDTMLAKAQTLNKTVETMKDYHEEIQTLNAVTNQLPRSSLIAQIQRESKQLRLLENENRELRSALEDHQYALELIMSKYRQQVTNLIKSRNASFVPVPPQGVEESQNLVRSQASKISDMTAVMMKAIEMDEGETHKETEQMAQLKVENDGLRELLKISRNQPTANVMSTSVIENPTILKRPLQITPPKEPIPAEAEPSTSESLP